MQGPVEAASTPHLLEPAIDQRMPVGAEFIELGVKRQRAVNVDTQALLRLQPGTSATLHLFDNATFDFVVDQRWSADRGVDVWIGRLADSPGSAVTLVQRDDQVAAAIHAGLLGNFEIRGLGDGRHMVRELDVPALRTCGLGLESVKPSKAEMQIAHERSATRSANVASNCDDGTVIDILVVYTADARAAAGGTAAMELAIDMAIVDANAAFDRSGIDTSLRLVHTEEVSYVETGDWQIDGPRLIHQNDGFLDIVHPLRNQHGADCVSLIVNTLNAGGIGYFPNLSPGGADSSGFSIVRRDNIAVGTLAHEIGHNLFCAHDRPNALDLPFADYSYGFVEPGGAWQTIMAVSPTAYIPYFANPDVIWPGPVPPNPGPTGVPAGQPDPNDVALTINETRHFIANFRATHVPGLPSVLHVRADAAPGGDGISWANAFDDLTACLCAADGSGGAVQEIWVKAGTYTSDRGTGDREATFRLREGLAIYGGFDGTETERTQRDWAANVTILSGDIGAGGDGSDNCYHVVDASQLDATAILDGFVITGGNADGVDPHDGGGGVLVHGGGSPTIRNCTITHNHASSFGAGIYNAFNSDPSFIDCLISSNSVSGATWPEGGGGIYNYDGSSPVLTGSTIQGNTAMLGSGMANFFGSSPQLWSCVIEGNLGPAGSEGGGIYGYVNCSPSLTDCIIRGNGAAYGGGMISYFGSSPTLTSCVLKDNTATNDGGGMYNYGESLAELTDCVIDNNGAAFGGGLTNLFNSNVTLTSCILRANVATGDGGALYNYSESNVELVNCLISGNQAMTGGGMINLFDSDVQIINSTLVGNEASGNGGGVYLHFSSPVVVSSILWANSAGGLANEDAQIFNFGGTTTIDHSTVQGWSGSLGGTNSDGADPLFVDADGPDNTFGTADDDARLTAASPAVDAGDNGSVPAGVVTDLAGNDRIFNGTVDRGAYEYAPAPGDFDGDGDVDEDDYLHLADCLSGPAQSPAPLLSTVQACLNAFDFDDDLDVDLQDAGAFFLAVAGS